MQGAVGFSERLRNGLGHHGRRSFPKLGGAGGHQKRKPGTPPPKQIRNWEGGRPRKMGCPDGYVVTGGFTWPRVVQHGVVELWRFAARDHGISTTALNGRGSALVEREGGPERIILLRPSTSGHVASSEGRAASECDVGVLGRGRGLLSGFQTITRGILFDLRAQTGMTSRWNPVAATDWVITARVRSCM